MSRRHNSALWDYLERRGVLEKGTDEEIKAAKRDYRKQYLLDFKRKQRAYKPEFTVNFSKDSGEWDRISLAAKRHRMTITGFIHVAALAYIDNTYLVPNKEQIAHLQLLLADCLNEVKGIANTKQKYFWEQDKRLETIEKKIEKLEHEISQVLCNPPLANDSKNKIL